MLKKVSRKGFVFILGVAYYLVGNLDTFWVRKSIAVSISFDSKKSWQIVVEDFEIGVPQSLLEFVSINFFSKKNLESRCFRGLKIM